MIMKLATNQLKTSQKLIVTNQISTQLGTRRTSCDFITSPRLYYGSLIEHFDSQAIQVQSFAKD